MVIQSVVAAEAMFPSPPDDKTIEASAGYI
jgi:hypothetical protein